VPDRLIRDAVRNGIAKINTDTDLRIGFTAGTREFLIKNPQVFDPRKITASARDLVTEIVAERIKVFGSAGRA
jgi:fructose-bisphosphate aldolase class II